METIAIRLQQLRKDAGLKKKDIAERAHISQSYISEIEAGKKDPPIKTLQKICSSLDVTLSEFFADENQTSKVPLNKIKKLNELFIKVENLPDDNIDTIIAILNVLVDCFKGKSIS